MSDTKQKDLILRMMGNPKVLAMTPWERWLLCCLYASCVEYGTVAFDSKLLASRFVLDVPPGEVERSLLWMFKHGLIAATDGSIHLPRNPSVGKRNTVEKPATFTQQIDFSQPVENKTLDTTPGPPPTTPTIPPSAGIEDQSVLDEKKPLVGFGLVKEFWLTRFKQETGTDYYWQAAKDSVGCNMLIRACHGSVDEAKALIERFIARWKLDPFWRRRGMSMALIPGGVNELRSVSAMARSPSAPGTSEDFVSKGRQNL